MHVQSGVRPGAVIIEPMTPSMSRGPLFHHLHPKQHYRADVLLTPVSWKIPRPILTSLLSHAVPNSSGTRLSTERRSPPRNRNRILPSSRGWFCPWRVKESLLFVSREQRVREVCLKIMHLYSLLECQLYLLEDSHVVPDCYHDFLSWKCLF